MLYEKTAQRFVFHFLYIYLHLKFKFHAYEKISFVLLTTLGMMYAYNVFADKTPSGGCETSDRTACYVLVVGGEEPFIVEPGINKIEFID